ncbi:MAG TPA: DUF5998 family protein [Nocardioidaceae bacterium]|jgi:hypothetical protein|nr:DUF5998 family protein [Nocardioidaceae bacterium]
MPDFASPLASTDAPDRTSDLRAAIDRCGYYPDVVAEALDDAVAGEPVRAFVVHHEPTFDREEVRRHVTVLALTPTRLVVGHTDEHPPDDVMPEPSASTSTEAVPLAGVTLVVVNRMVANPATGTGRTGRRSGANEVVLTVGWGAVGRIDLEPATCGDPDCDGDHGYSGSVSADDFSIRVSSAADGADSVHHLLDFARALSAATASGR